MLDRFRVKKASLWLAILLATLFLPHAPLQAQYTTASLGGTVTDTSGAVVPSATITVQNTGTDLTKSMQSGEDGTFLFPILPVGTYTLTVEKVGFKAYIQTGITLRVNQAVTQGVVLQVGSTSEHVTVSANAEMLKTHTATVDQLVGQERIVELPLNGRQAQSLIFLSQGTVDTTSHYCGFNCQGGVYPGAQEAIVNGGGTANVSYMMDGIENNDTYINMNRPFPNPDALQEFTVQLNNMSAEFGGGGNVVNVVTKSGTNQFHGDVFEFLRNGALNARNFFAPIQDTLKRNQFGGTIGGPIKKDKLFFFATYQGTRYVQTTQSNVANVPTAAERGGDFSALCSSFSTSGLCNPDAGTQLIDPNTNTPFFGNQIPVGRFSGPSNYFLQKIPLPNGPASLPNQLTFAGPVQNQPENQVMGRVDWTHGKSQLSARYFFTDWKNAVDLAAADTNLLAADPNGNKERVQTLALNETYSFSPSTIMNTWFGWAHQTGGTVSGTSYGFPDAGVKIYPVPGQVSIPELAVGGYFSASGLWPSEFDRGDYRIRETITHQKGSHEFSFGGDLYHIGAPQNNAYQNGGAFYFNDRLSGDNLADFLLGNVTSFSQNAPTAYEYVGYNGNVFARDNWRVSRNLTLNLGVRWDPYFPYGTSKHILTCWRPGMGPSKRYPNAPIGYLFEGDKGCPYGGTYSNLSNIAPRFGFSYRLEHNIVLRGGVGTYYVRPQMSQANWATTNPPFSIGVGGYATSFADPFGAIGLPNPFPAAYTAGPPGPDYVFQLPIWAGAIESDFHISALTTWNLMVEHQFASNWMASIGYVGNAGYHLSSNQSATGQDGNPAVYIPGNSTEANTQDRRLNPNFGNQGMYTGTRNSKYSALQMNVEKRFSHGLSFVANYTWQRTIDDFPPLGAWEATDPFNIRSDYGVSNDNVSSLFHLSEVWQIPHMQFRGILGALSNGWEATSILTWQGGFPFAVFSGVDNSFSGIYNDRADFTGTKYNQAVRSGLSHNQMVNGPFFDTSLFTVNAIGTFGNTAKNILTGPRLFNTDFALIKDTRITENTKVQFRAEAFNVFNNVNFNNPQNTVGSPTFGFITSAKDPRILQFGLKVVF